MEQKELELYVHIPFCMKKCLYCDFLSAPADEETQREYVEALLREIRFFGERSSDYVVSTIYIGGGTPSWLDESLMAKIMEEITHRFLLAKDAEITIECNPGTVTERKFQVYKKIGINRLSIGLQSVNEKELQLLGRVHTFDQFLKTYELARKTGFTNINVDLMSSLPGQTPKTFAKTLQQVIRLHPEHISAYSLIIEKGTPFYETYKFDAVKQRAGMQTEFLPTEDEEYEIGKLTQVVLEKAGYHRYEVSNYAREGYACRHNIGYWRRTNYLGMGLGAASLLENIRYTNTSDLYHYIEESVDIKNVMVPVTLANQTTVPVPATNLSDTVDVIERNAQMEEFMFLGLRMTQGVFREDFERAFGMTIESVYGEVLQTLLQEGLLEKSEGRIFLTDRGMELNSYVTSQFLFGN
ncbi:MAG: radical SAM family heme chaperone HemW [Roseburia sp.]|nr:radical SAM family heme chaperone HemW [Roseburia sp. 831b]MDD6217514.1 radical SAM family heme chaperone HemW [Roseburia sp.]WVK73614.1 radical SAM family heme chaperone HemW [Roseburia sp. 831b]